MSPPAESRRELHEDAAGDGHLRNEVEIGLTFYSEILTEPGVDAVGVLPASISPRTSLVAFVGAKAKNADAGGEMM